MKLFRFHKGSLHESLETTIEVNNIEEIKELCSNNFLNTIKNIYIKKCDIEDNRLPKEWNKTSNLVMITFEGNDIAYPIGYTNFYE